MSIQQIKARIRRDILQQRRHLSRTIQHHAETHVVTQIQNLSIYQQAQTVACYFSIHGEPSISSLWHPFPTHKTMYFPVIDSHNVLLFLPYTPDTPIKTNRWGISEPQVAHTQAIENQHIQIIFMPLVAFDMQGTRLGMGGGYYDRCLKDNVDSLRIGVAYEFQKHISLPKDSWDIPLHAVITETSTYWFSKPNLL